MEWWYIGNDCGLKGVEGDVDNPPILEAFQIQEFLIRYPEARASFLRLFPKLLLEEQQRVIELYQSALKLKNDIEPHAESDKMQSNWNKNLKVRQFGWHRPRRR